MKTHINKNYLFAIFGLFLLLSYYFYWGGYLKVSNIVNGGSDMQWHPSTILWLGINPYIDYLTNPIHFMAQKPNYGHLLYILMYPFAMMDWEYAKITWGAINMFLLPFIVYTYFKNRYNLSYLVFVSIFLLSSSVYLTIVFNGQMTLIIAFFTTIAWLYRKKSQWIMTLSLSIIFVKYSFGFPILWGFFMAGYHKEVIIAVVINLLVVLGFAIYFDMGFIESLRLPFQVALSKTQIGPIDLMSLERVLSKGVEVLPDINASLAPITVTLQKVQNLNENITRFTYVVVPMIYLSLTWIIYRQKEYLSDNIIIASSIFLSMITFFHLEYDQAMLLIALVIIQNDLKLKKIYLIILTSITIILWQQYNLFIMKAGFNLECPDSLYIYYNLLFITVILFSVFSMILSPYQDNKS